MGKDATLLHGYGSRNMEDKYVDFAKGDTVEVVFIQSEYIEVEKDGIQITCRASDVQIDKK